MLVWFPPLRHVDHASIFHDVESLRWIFCSARETRCSASASWIGASQPPNLLMSWSLVMSIACALHNEQMSASKETLSERPCHDFFYACHPLILTRNIKTCWIYSIEIFFFSFWRVHPHNHPRFFLQKNAQHPDLRSVRLVALHSEPARHAGGLGGKIPRAGEGRSVAIPWDWKIHWRIGSKRKQTKWILSCFNLWLACWVERPIGFKGLLLASDVLEKKGSNMF